MGKEVNVASDQSDVFELNGHTKRSQPTLARETVRRHSILMPLTCHLSEYPLKIGWYPPTNAMLVGERASVCWVSKGIHHYWKYYFSWGLNQMEVEETFEHGTVVGSLGFPMPLTVFGT